MTATHTKQAMLAELVALARQGRYGEMARIRATLTQGEIHELQHMIVAELTDRTVSGVEHHLGPADFRCRAACQITVEPFTEALRELPGRHADPHAVAVVARHRGSGAVEVHDTADSEWYARQFAWDYAAHTGATLALTALQVARGDVLIDQRGDRHPVRSVYPVDQISVTVHTETGQHLHATWSEAHTDRYTVETREVTP